MHETLLQLCSTDKDKSGSIIVGESSTEESKSEYVHKSVNKEKMQIMMQSMSNFRFRMIQLSRIRTILTYSNVKIISLTSLIKKIANKRVW